MSRKIKVSKPVGSSRLFDDNDSVSDKTEALINNLFKSENILKEQDILRKLKDMYKDNDKLVRKAYKYFTKRYEAIDKHALLFKEKLLSKYQYLDLPKIIKKAQQYARKYHLSDPEFHLFINLIKRDNIGKYNKDFFVEEQTPMGHALGYQTKKMQSLSYSADDEVYLNKIIDYYQKTMQLNQKVKVQSLTYTSCAYQALSGEYNEHFDNNLNYVHPLLAAMFIPKIDALEERFIMTNIAGIVNSLYTMKPIKDYPNRILYEDIATDKNQLAYSKMKPFEDLYIRSKLQAKLWEGIIYLRTGKYFKYNNSEFNELIGKYPINIFDAPDMSYTQDAGNILRRLLNAFSFKPSVVRIIKTEDRFKMFDDHLFKQKTVENKKLVNIVSIINIRLPTDDTVNYDLHLSDNITSSQWFSKSSNLTPVSYEQKIIKSEGVIFYYVNRNYNTITIDDTYKSNDVEERLLTRHDMFKYNGSYMINSLPYIFSDTQKLNKRPVYANDNIIIAGDTFTLRSCVLTESIKLDDIDIAGHTSAIILDKNGQVYYYNPSKAGTPYSENTKLNPINLISKDEAMNFIATNGVIYIYEKSM